MGRWVDETVSDADRIASVTGPTARWAESQRRLP